MCRIKVLVGTATNDLFSVSCRTATRAPAPPASTPPSPPPAWATASW